MAIPLLAPLVPFVPVLKVLALGSIKFVALAVGASVVPVHTANFLVGMSSNTPLKHAEFRYQKGHISKAEIDRARAVFQALNESITNPDLFLSRVEARAFLISIMKDTWLGMKQSVVSLPSRIAIAVQDAISWVSSLVGAKDK
jgi:hypothetical protein